MIINNPNKHLTDQEFFTYIKFFDFVIEKKEINDPYVEDAKTFSLHDIEIGDDELGYVFNRIFMSGQVLDLSVNIEREYELAEEIEEAKKDIQKRSDQNKLLKIIEDIRSGKKIKLVDINDISWVWYEIYERIEFTPYEYKLPKKIETMIRMEMDKYLDNFINDKLAIARKNYYKFETQKQALIKLIEDGKKIAHYGNNFIIIEEIDRKCVLEKIPDFCIIHTVYALQRLGYLKVVNVWAENKHREGIYSVDPDKYINVNIVLEDAFIREINNKYKKDNPKNIFEKFDEKRGILKFAGQEIELAKKSRETDAVLLLKTLLKEESDEWKHNDEILEDWGYNLEDQKDTPKNKVYFAGQKINNAVALKTQIEDFIECNTSKARINPKYRKIDE